MDSEELPDNRLIGPYPAENQPAALASQGPLCAVRIFAPFAWRFSMARNSGVSFPSPCRLASRVHFTPASNMGEGLPPVVLNLSVVWSQVSSNAASPWMAFSRSQPAGLTINWRPSSGPTMASAMARSRVDLPDALPPTNTVQPWNVPSGRVKSNFSFANPLMLSSSTVFTYMRRAPDLHLHRVHERSLSPLAPMVDTADAS
jgi:hypothetical protein